MNEMNQQVIEEEWVSLPGGELEGKRPKTLCPACRARGTPSHTLCFACYRAGGACGPREDRESSRVADSQPKSQSSLPFEPINRPRLASLKAERAAVRVALLGGPGRFEARRRQAQIAARHALQRIEAALEARHVEPATRARIMASAVHAAELQFPESWLPFVVAR